MTNTIIRPAAPADIAFIQAIYAYYVENTVITFEETTPDATEMTRRFDEIKSHDMPYLVLEQDGRVLGYAYASVFRSRRAFRYSVEHSIYLDPDTRGQGFGKKMMNALLEALVPTGVRQMVAVISDKKDGASVALHRSSGFEMIGTLPATGYKFDTWIDTIIMQRPVGDGQNTPPTTGGLKLT